MNLCKIHRFKDGSIFYNSHNVAILNSQDKSTLSIQKAGTEDTGNYHCESESTKGLLRTDFYLSVIGGASFFLL